MTLSINNALPRELFQWLYETEYRRSFSPKKQSTDHSPQPIFDKGSTKNTNIDKHLTTVSIQTEQPKSILKQTIRPSSAPVHKSYTVESLSKTDHKKDRDNNKTYTVKQTVKEPVDHGNMVTDKNSNSGYIDLVAGKNSRDYIRSPFIQSKKKVKHRRDSIVLGQNENIVHKNLNNYVYEPEEPQFDVHNRRDSYNVDKRVSEIVYTPEKETVNVENVLNKNLDFVKTVPSVKHYANILDTVAGNQSAEYHRAPFIQSKKKIKHRTDAVRLTEQFNDDKVAASVVSLRDEPEIPRKRITRYVNNHNILRTYTTEEDMLYPKLQDADYSTSNPDQDQAEKTQTNYPSEKDNNFEEKILDAIPLNRYQEHRPKTAPTSYRTSYNDDFNFKTSYVHSSPVLLAEKRLNLKNRLWDIRHYKENKEFVSKWWDDVYQKQYDKCRYETEYDRSYTNDVTNDVTHNRQTKMSKRLEKEKENKDKFLDYYEQVLENRVVAYHPVLENYARAKSPEYRKTIKSVENHITSTPSSIKTKRNVYDPSRYTDEF